jgi:hypothetical protein
MITSCGLRGHKKYNLNNSIFNFLKIYQADLFENKQKLT